MLTRNETRLFYATVDCPGHYLNGKRLAIREFLGKGRVALIAPGCKNAPWCDVELGPMQYDFVAEASRAEVKATHRDLKKQAKKNPPLRICPRQSAAVYIEQMLAGETVKDLYKGYGDTMRYLSRAVAVLNWNRVRTDGLPEYNWQLSY